MGNVLIVGETADGHVRTASLSAARAQPFCSET